MSDDLVKRLRMWARFGHCVEHVVEAEATMEEAANHIEKLEAALNRVVDLTDCWENSLISQVNEIVRKALEGKDD
jgi:hypothetical protein